MEALVCEMRRAHPRWGPRRIGAELAKGPNSRTVRSGWPHWSSIYRTRTLVDIDVHEAEFHVYDQAGEPLVVIPRTSSKEVTRTKGYGVPDRVG